MVLEFAQTLKVCSGSSCLSCFQIQVFWQANGYVLTEIIRLSMGFSHTMLSKMWTLYCHPKMIGLHPAKLKYKISTYGCFLKWWYLQIIHFNRVFHYKPSIWGTTIFGNPHMTHTGSMLWRLGHHFGKHPMNLPSDFYIQKSTPPSGPGPSFNHGSKPPLQCYVVKNQQL